MVVIDADRHEVVDPPRRAARAPGRGRVLARDHAIDAAVKEAIRSLTRSAAVEWGAATVESAVT
jgi:hypothetical protein